MRNEEGWRSTPEDKRSEGEVKEGSRRMRRKSMWLKRSEEEGGEWPRGRGGEEGGGKSHRVIERRAHGHRKSGHRCSHAKSSDGDVCSHPGDVATKRFLPLLLLLPLLNSHNLPSPPLQITAPRTISSCSHVGPELETRQERLFCGCSKCAAEQTQASLTQECLTSKRTFQLI